MKLSSSISWRTNPQSFSSSASLGVNDPQAAYLLLLMSGATRANFWQRTLRPEVTESCAIRHDENVWSCLRQILGTPNASTAAHTLSALSLSAGRLGLLFRTGRESQCAVIASAREARSAHEGNRSPQTTSEVVGTSPSAPRPPRRSSSDIANVCAAQHGNAVHQRLNQERRATARISGGSDLALARARCRKKSWASSDHRQARTTKRARPYSPVNSRYLRSLVRRAWSRAAPSRMAHCLRGAPSARTGLTKVVSIANWAPWKRGKPSATTSRRRSSNWPPGKRSRSWT